MTRRPTVRVQSTVERMAAPPPRFIIPQGTAALSPALFFRETAAHCSSFGEQV